MNKLTKCSILSVFSTAICISSASAAVIVPQSISLLSGTKTNETPLSRMIDGSGLSDLSLSADLLTVTHNSTDMNEARLFTSSEASVRLDLGNVFNIEKAWYWNTNTIAFNDVGFISYNFLDSQFSSIFNSGNVSLPGPFNLVDMPSNLYDTGNVVGQVRYVDVVFIRRSGGSVFAPGEIRFEGTVVPEPLTILGTFTVMAFLPLMKAQKK
ncbi:MAG: PEP-CTERM sorting domain-containing protein [Gloeocapsa sp. DLM2.Bin57]|nr:MAG: PEP-CTERM sorting domain-containing protein [Gloeocapsa sp. DLM2.Bin57]